MLLRAQLGFIYEGGAQYWSSAAYKELELRQGYTCFQSKDRSQSTHDGSEGEGKIQGSHERERERERDSVATSATSAVAVSFCLPRAILVAIGI